jgi:hypothetical protein
MENINWFQDKRAYRKGSFTNKEIIKELLKKKESKKEKMKDNIYLLSTSNRYHN